MTCDCAARLRAEAERATERQDLPLRDQAARAKRAAWYRLAADFLERSKR
jgi:hypothetical protein